MTGDPAAGPFAAARLVSALAAGHPARAGWVTGRVVEAHPDGTLRLSMPGGSVLLRVPGAQADIGAMLRVRIDGQAASLQPASPPGSAAASAAPLAPSPAAGAASSGYTLPPAALELPPVLSGGAGKAEGQAAQALAAIFPAAGTPAFAWLAAMFPLVLRNGTLRAVVPPRQPGSAPQGRLAEAARAALDLAAARAGDDPAFLRWTMPYFANGTLRHSAWAASGGEGDAPLHVSVEGKLPGTGAFRLHGILDGDALSLHLQSERSTEALGRDLARLAAESGTALNLEVTFSQSMGPLPMAAEPGQR